jgi:SAM-dependent methyltransferase
MIGRCLQCEGENLAFVRKYRTQSHSGARIFGSSALYECSDCGLVQSAPRPDPLTLSEYYKLDYRTKGYGGSDVADVSRFPHDNLFYYNRGQSITELLRRFLSKNNPRILDIGAGYGHILYFLGETFRGSSRFAIEFSEACGRHLKSQQIEVRNQPVEQVLSEMKDQFDLVTLSHVLEHLLDPKQVLKLIYSSLKEGGLLYIEVPNIPADCLLRYPDHIWAPRHDEPHITFYSEAVLTKLVQSAGFELQFSSTAGPEYRYVSSLRYGMPPLRSTIESWIPPALFQFLRSHEFTKPLRVQNREESFFQYGGHDRIWIRTVWKKQPSEGI